jgi:hypothetical protein
MNDRTNHGSGHNRGCCDGRSSCDGVVTAAAAVVAPSAVVTTAMVVVVDVGRWIVGEGIVAVGGRQVPSEGPGFLSRVSPNRFMT